MPFPPFSLIWIFAVDFPNGCLTSVLYSHLIHLPYSSLTGLFFNCKADHVFANLKILWWLFWIKSKFLNETYKALVSLSLSLSSSCATFSLLQQVFFFFFIPASKTSSFYILRVFLPAAVHLENPLSQCPPSQLPCWLTYLFVVSLIAKLCLTLATPWTVAC